MKLLLTLTLAMAMLTGCMSPRPQKPGNSTISTPGGVVSSIQQPENPKDASSHSVDRSIEIVLPPGVPLPPGSVVKIHDHAEAKVGAAQKDTAREMAAKLSALKPVVWIGILMFIAGVASAVYPPLRALVGSITTSVVCAVSGLALIVLPSIIVGQETLILIIGVAAALVWFFAHRHGHLKGQLSTLLEKK